MKDIHGGARPKGCTEALDAGDECEHVVTLHVVLCGPMPLVHQPAGWMPRDSVSPKGCRRGWGEASPLVPVHTAAGALPPCRVHP